MNSRDFFPDSLYVTDGDAYDATADEVVVNVSGGTAPQSSAGNRSAEEGGGSRPQAPALMGSLVAVVPPQAPHATAAALGRPAARQFGRPATRPADLAGGGDLDRAPQVGCDD